MVAVMTAAKDKSGPEPLPTGLALAGANAEFLMGALVQDFFIARMALKGSPHTEAAYRSDLAAISVQLAADVGTEPGELRLGPSDGEELAPGVRHLLGRPRCWQHRPSLGYLEAVLRFLVADEVVVGNPMVTMAKPKVPAGAPKALQGEGTP
jgi:integrase/recombinase XerD